MADSVEQRTLQLRDDIEIDVPRRCGNCAYELTCLPNAGHCPECGDEYLEDELVLFGWAGRSRADLSTGKPARVVWGLVVIVLQLAIVLLTGALDSPIVAGIWIIGIALTILALWRRYMNAAVSPAPLQVRISPRGFGLRHGVRPVKCERWNDALHCEAKKAGKHMIRILLSNTFDSVPLNKVDLLIESESSPEVWQVKLSSLIGLRSRGSIPAS